MATDPEAEVSGLQVFPNPASGRLRVRFGLDGPARVRISLRTVLGREIAVVTDRPFRLRYLPADVDDLLDERFRQSELLFPEVYTY